MPDRQAPGVYVEVLAPSARPVAELVPERLRTTVGDAERRPRWRAEHTVTAFLGFSERGPYATPTLVREWAEFAQVFGDHVEGVQLPHAVYGFFANGGSACHVIRVSPEDTSAALAALSRLDEVSLLCAPDLTSYDGATETLLAQLVAHCERHQDRMVLFDTPPGLTPQQVRDWRIEHLSLDSPAAAVYYPWVRVPDPSDGLPRDVPPSGHVAGVYARTDAVRGFHHTPANETVRGADGTAYALAQPELDLLVPIGVNPLLVSPSRGVVLWGSRTLSSDPDWRYLRRQRLVGFVIRRVREGTRWAILHRTDDATLRPRVAADVSDLLHLLWRGGALWGESPQDAYSVGFDEGGYQAGRFTVDCGLGIERGLSVGLRVHYVCEG